MSSRIPTVSCTYRRKRPLATATFSSDSEISSDENSFKPRTLDLAGKSKKVNEITKEVSPEPKLSYLDFLDPGPLDDDKGDSLVSSVVKDIEFEPTKYPVSRSSVEKNKVITTPTHLTKESIQKNTTQFSNSINNETYLNSKSKLISSEEELSEEAEETMPKSNGLIAIRFPTFKEPAFPKNNSSILNGSHSTPSFECYRRKENPVDYIGANDPTNNRKPKSSSRGLKRYSSSNSNSKRNSSRNLRRTNSYGNESQEDEELSSDFEPTKQPRKKRSDKPVKLTPYELQLKEEIQLYHDKVELIIREISFTENQSGCHDRVVELVDSLSASDFNQKMRTYQHLEPLFTALTQTLAEKKDVTDPILELGILAFICIVAKDSVHVEIILEYDFVVNYLIRVIESINSPVNEDNTRNSESFKSHSDSILESIGRLEVFRYNVTLPTKHLLATQCLIQMTEAGGRCLKKTRRMLLNFNGLESLLRVSLTQVKALIRHASSNDLDVSLYLDIALLRLLTCLLHEESGHDSRSKLIKDFPDLIPTLLKIIQDVELTPRNTTLVEIACKLLIDLTNHHLEAILQVGNSDTIDMIIQRMTQVWEIGSRETDSDDSVPSFTPESILLPLTALLINLNETPQLPHLNHLPPMFIDFGAFIKCKSLENVQFRAKTPILILTKLFLNYSAIESHESWTLAGYLSTLISFILLGLHTHNHSILTDRKLLNLHPTLKLSRVTVNQIKTLLPEGDWGYLVSFLDRFKELTSQLSLPAVTQPDPPNLKIPKTKSDPCAPEIYYTTPTPSISATLTKLLAHLHTYD